VDPALLLSLCPDSVCFDPMSDETFDNVQSRDGSVLGFDTRIPFILAGVSNSPLWGALSLAADNRIPRLPAAELGSESHQSRTEEQH
jgi:hypothetical protein